jgi:hypothetical protein
MKPVLLFTSCALAAGALLAGAGASAQVYRCPNNEYTNQIKGRTDCVPVKNDGVIIINSTPAPAAAKGSGGGAAAASAPRVESAEQRAKDADAKAILEAELRRAQARQAELEKDYNNGQPEKIGNEAKNYQKYVDRVGAMKADIDRNKSDIEGIQRELARYSAAVATPAPAASNP